MRIGNGLLGLQQTCTALLFFHGFLLWRPPIANLLCIAQICLCERSKILCCVAPRFHRFIGNALQFCVILALKGLGNVLFLPIWRPIFSCDCRHLEVWGKNTAQYNVRLFSMAANAWKSCSVWAQIVANGCLSRDNLTIKVFSRLDFFWRHQRKRPLWPISCVSCKLNKASMLSGAFLEALKAFAAKSMRTEIS